ncbi:MAG TPA: hypothetical protein VMT35_01525, partial [Ignavibacteriaceae bacterium]|nr:hypothetical protein [Ignavibacteriaceae bacterium]
MRLKILVFILFLAGFRNFEIISQIYDRDESGKEEHEDPDRVKKVYRESMSAAEYTNALEVSGMKEAKQNEKVSSTSWLSIGPVGAISPYGYNGRISGIYVRGINNGYYVYAGACSGGLWRARSSDGIGVWNSLGDGLPNPSVRAFAVHPDNPDDIFVGTGDYSRYKGGGMFHTVNAGINWSKITLPKDPTEFYRIEYLPGNNKVLNAACTDGILRSTDGGNTWKNVLAGEATDLIINPTIPNIQYTCVVNKGVFRTLNGGETWQLVNAVTSPFGRASIALCNADPSTLALLVEDGSANLQGVFISNNGGANWDNITNNINGLSSSSGQVDHAQAVLINPYDPNDIWVASVSAFESVDGGKNWSSKDLGHADFAALYVNPASGNKLWAGNDGGIFAYESGNVQNWNGNSVTGLRCSEIDFMDSKRGFRTIGLQDNGIIRSTDYGGNWSTVHTGDGFGTTITDDLNFTFWFTDGQYPAPARRVWKQPLSGDAEYQPNPDENLYIHWYDKYSRNIYVSSSLNLLSKNVDSPQGAWSVDGNLPNSDVHLIYGSSLDGQTVYVTQTSPKIIVGRRNGTAWN